MNSRGAVHLDEESMQTSLFITPGPESAIKRPIKRPPTRYEIARDYDIVAIRPEMWRSQVLVHGVVLTIPPSSLFKLHVAG